MGPSAHKSSLTAADRDAALAGDQEIPPLLGELRFGMITVMRSYPLGSWSAGYASADTETQIEIFDGANWVARDSQDGIAAHNSFVRKATGAA